MPVRRAVVVGLWPKRAASRAKRDPASVRLIAVSKTFPTDYVRAAADAGQVDFGENKVQEGLAKIAQTSDLPLRWHLIGHLQSNKAKQAIAFQTIQSVDSSDLLQKVEHVAAGADRTVDVLIQVDQIRRSARGPAGHARGCRGL